MTVINKYPNQTKKRNKEFFKRKDQELTNLDWAKWAGWFDTDGCFTKQWNKDRKCYQLFADLRLSDRQPVELFSDIFETSLRYQKADTVTPNGNHYVAKQFRAVLSGPKATWFTENVSPYLIRRAKREYAGRLLGDPVRSKDFNTWTRDELTHYLATVIEGDGGIQVLSALTGNSKSCIMTISSNDKHYLASLVSISASRLNIISRFKKITRSYETKRGPVHMYKLYLQCSRRNTENLDFLKSLLQYNVMTLDRKKEKVQEFLTWMALNYKPDLKIESRV